MPGRSRLLLLTLVIPVQRLAILVQRLVTPVRLLATPVRLLAILALRLAIPAILALVRATPAPPTKVFLDPPLPPSVAVGLSKTVCGPEMYPSVRRLRVDCPVDLHRFVRPLKAGLRYNASEVPDKIRETRVC